MTSDHWSGPTRPYDLVKEVVVAVVAMAALALTLAAVFSSPDDRQVTIQRWATADPAGFVATAVTELDGTSASAAYGPPYNRASDGQSIFALHLQRWVGVHQPVDPSQDFVLRPLSTVTGDPALTSALASYTAATGGQRQRWASAYDAAIGTAGGDPAKAAPGDYGPVPMLVTSLADLARTGALDSQLVGHSAGLYQADSTSPLLFLADGDYLAAQAHARHLTGTQWGMMNETGNYPGQAWLCLHVLVPDPALHPLRQRRRPDLGADDGAVAGVGAGAVHPRPPLAAPLVARAPAGVARLVREPPGRPTSPHRQVRSGLSGDPQSGQGPPMASPTAPHRGSGPRPLERRREVEHAAVGRHDPVAATAGGHADRR